MNVSGHTILVTGGGSGIGLALAKRFAAAGNEVIVCGRREAALRDARAATPSLHAHACDVSRPEEREALIRWATTEFPAFDVLVNNAGIQQQIDLSSPPPWTDVHGEIVTNLEAPVHLAMLAIPHLRTKQAAAILNVTSGLAFVPRAAVPVYCATKAAMRSFTLSLRHQLAGTSIEVVEIIPPAVNTDLGGPGLHTFGADLDAFADATFSQLRDGAREATFGFSADAKSADAAGRDALFARMNSH